MADPFDKYVVQDDPFDAYEVKPESLRGPSPRSQALRSIPLMPGPLPFLAGNVTAGQVGGLAPDVLGAVGGATFGVPGAAAGGALGRGLEDVIGLDFPSSLGDAGRRYGSEAALQGSMQAIPSLLTRAGKGLHGFRDWARAKGIRQTQEQYLKPKVAGRAVKAERLKKEVPAATEARIGAAATTKAAAREQVEKTPLDELVDEMVSMREKREGIEATDQVRAAIERDVRRRIQQVLPKATGRLVNPKLTARKRPTLLDARGNPLPAAPPPKREFSAARLLRIRQAFDDLNRAANKGRKTGIKPKPGDDIDIADAARRILHNKYGLTDLDKATAKAIESEQSLKQMQARTLKPEAQAIRDAERMAEIQEKVLLARTANPLKLVSAIPVRGGFAPPGVALKTASGVFSELAGKLGTGLSHPRGEEIAFAFPRFVALMKYLNEQQPPAPPVDPFGMYVAPPDSLTPP